MSGWPAIVAATAAALPVLDGRTAPRLRALGLSPPGSGWPVLRRAGLRLSPRTPARWGRDLADAAVSIPASLALELRSGREVAAALRAVAQEHGHLDELARRLSAAAAVAGTGGDPGGSLAHRPTERSSLGAGHHQRTKQAGDALRPTASCLSAGHRSGLPVADLLESASASAASAAEISALARAELAGARASGYLLAGLPVAGVGLGQLLGAQPLSFLVVGGWGRVCLVSACLLVACGALWNRALTAGLTRELS